MIVILICTCIATAKKKKKLPEWDCQKLNCFVFVQQGAAWIFCVSSWKLNFTLKKPQPISIALLSAILPTTQEKVDDLLGIDHGIKVSYLVAVEVLELQHQLAPTCASKFQPHAPTWAHGCCQSRYRMGPRCEGLLRIWCSTSWEGSVREISCHSHIEISS